MSDPLKLKPAPKSGARETALWVLAWGGWPVALRAPGEPLEDGSGATGKEPARNAWGKERPTPDSLLKDFHGHRGRNVGARLGPTGGWGDIEGDGPDWREQLDSLCGGEVLETLGWDSKRGGHNMVLPPPPELAGIPSGAKFPWSEFADLEIRLNGKDVQSQSVIPPSATDDFAREWRGPWRIAPMPGAMVQRIAALWEEDKKRRNRYEGAHRRARKAAAGGSGELSTIDAFNQAQGVDGIVAMLTARNWRVTRNSGEVVYLAHPEATARWSASVGYCGDRLFCWSNNTTFPVAKPQDAFDVFMALEHGGDFRRALIAARERGYGPRPTSSAGANGSANGHANGHANGQGGDSSHSSFVRNGSSREQSPPDPESVVVKSWPAPLRPEAFHGVAGRIVRAIEPSSEADPAGLLSNVLAMAGSRIGRGPRVEIGGSIHHGNEFIANVGDSGTGRKGTATNAVSAVYDVAAPDWRRDRMRSGLVSGEGLVYHVRDERVGPDKKGEVVVLDPGERDKRLLAYEPELAAVFRVLERDGNKLASVLRQGWDGGRLDSLAKNEPMTATGAHISLISHVTPEDLARYMSATDAANGLAGRFLWFAVRRSKVVPPIGAPKARTADVALELSTAFEWADSHGWSSPMEWEADAAAMFNEAYLAEQEKHVSGLLGCILTRRESHIARLALIYAVLDRRWAIGVEHVQAATAVWDYCSESAKYIFGDHLGDPQAEKVLAYLKQAGDGGRSKAEIVHNVFHRHIKAEALVRILATLERQGMVTRSRRETGGRPAEIWTAVPTATRGARKKNKVGEQSEQSEQNEQNNHSQGDTSNGASERTGDVSEQSPSGRRRRGVV